MEIAQIRRIHAYRPLVGMLEHSGKKPLFVSEVVIDSANMGPCLSADHPDGGGLVTVFGKYLPASLYQPGLDIPIVFF